VQEQKKRHSLPRVNRFKKLTSKGSTRSHAFMTQLAHPRVDTVTLFVFVGRKGLFFAAFVVIETEKKISLSLHSEKATSVDDGAP
jgi:hypothetical protein